MTFNGDPANVAEHVAADLDVGVERVEEMLGQLETPDASLEAHAEALGVPTGELAIEAPDPPPDEILEQIQARDEMRRAVSSSLASLDDRERTVLHRKYLTDEPDTLAEIGRGLGISRERSRQIANEALGKLAAVMEESFPRASELVR